MGSADDRGATLSPKARRVGLGGITREDFEARYHIPAATLCAWERGEAKPDAAMLSYLVLIDTDPAGVATTLASRKPPLAAE